MRYRTLLLEGLKTGNDGPLQDCMPLIQEWFDCTIDQAERIVEIARQGWDDGCAGAYPDSDYSSDADWCYGVGADINKLETELDIDDGSVFDVYQECHGHGLEQAVTVCVDMTSDEGPMVYVQGPLAELWHDAERSVCGSNIEYADGKDFAYVKLDEGTSMADVRAELGHWKLREV